MKNANQFLIISLIIHLLVFIVLACVILPPVDKFKEFLERLSVDIVEAEPVIRKEPLIRAKIEPKGKSEVSQERKPPEPESFSPIVEESIGNRRRITSSEKIVNLRALPERKGIISAQPLALKPVSRSVDDRDIVMIPAFYQDEGSIAVAGGTKDASGHQLGLMGSGMDTRGLSAYYLSYSGMSPQPRCERADEFEKILPALARGILEWAIKKKIDIIFVIDATGSMRDNVRGVKEYIHCFLEPMKEKRIDVALGLVEFADLETTEAKVIGLTQDQEKFKKWLDKTRFFGGEDAPESGYEAMIAALEGIGYRDGAQKSFIFISDAPQHDFDYDGKSRYSLDRIIAKLNDEGVRVDVVGADYLPMKQLAYGTGGQWKHIPGGDPTIDVPCPTSSMIRSMLDKSLPPVVVEDKVTVEFNNRTPDWVDLSYKMLDPRGFKCLGTLTYRKKIHDKTEKRVEFSPKMDFSKFKERPGTYTLIYRIRDSLGNWDVLRRTLELRRADG